MAKRISHNETATFIAVPVSQLRFMFSVTLSQVMVNLLLLLTCLRIWRESVNLPE